MDWLKQLKYDPIRPLLESGGETIRYFTRRDLLDEAVEPVKSLWKLKQPQQFIRKLSVGSEEHDLLETFKNLQALVYKYELNRSHPAIAGACEYIFSYQSEESDFRGFIGNQYAPYYTGLVAALLIKGGYVDDPRVEKALKWLISMRQNDGGWVIGSPGILGIPNLKWSDLVYLTSDKYAETMRSFDPSRPFSHTGTGMVIRAFAAHPRYRRSPEALQAAGLLKSHFFKEDNYSSYKHPDHWIRFQFPFWWNNLLAALDSLSQMGIPPADTDVKKALDWFRENQQPDGLWEISYSRIHKSSVNKNTEETRFWISLAVCRVWRRFYEREVVPGENGDGL